MEGIGEFKLPLGCILNVVVGVHGACVRTGRGVSFFEPFAVRRGVDTPHDVVGASMVGLGINMLSLCLVRFWCNRLPGPFVAILSATFLLGRELALEALNGGFRARSSLLNAARATLFSYLWRQEPARYCVNLGS
jgi:hypothetical protein